MERNTCMILALDVTEREEALKIAENVREFVDAIKVGYPLILATGLDIIRELARFAPVIADFKVADIPNTNRLICEQVFKAGADAVIVQGFTGRDSLDACIEVASKYGKDVFVVSEMSHPGGAEFLQSAAEAIAKMAVEAGAFGLVAPATRPERVKEIRKIIGDRLTIISPGVGAQGGKASDVISAGADWVIVGRSIYKAESPKEAACEIAEEIQAELRGK
ncbi:MULTISPECIES: orotidine-5'-phosphate decarboxylase [Methanosarcina]|jgi:orotidine-5'-phosphate decarboxylase|uniref:Orotidine 5'-phosphate decarboxylase n=6 Tax=Methanosarcina mazei TaxID=2209 RepID=PYRF_METMA|nr:MULTISPECIES: orotidine-5'-phosphate decarboxylase [Methanosarcina]Q8PV88.1 RecName: Full=Orotidine 5'-phosphate decarboxylase; AltName: Full=OMP decarboxylase; Short=OMPDCase; Short=OMPdecase [Methanosarcina mazei Go1]AAM31779.1 Orotidine 5'-phosphate decarboxylase [Methanosarcina mazei Go1]AGF97478.1 Orotidine 5'-phosphate decarboxylase [Methanosarcina mazei Tuc01]AKB41549.1 Orotidine 5'-phosphate decarboxylase [Methanosarcina mazei WWM610]AKB69062.1 Orotidine 5'-phosphate decarboxylase [